MLKVNVLNNMPFGIFWSSIKLQILYCFEKKKIQYISKHDPECLRDKIYNSIFMSHVGCSFLVGCSLWLIILEFHIFSLLPSWNSPNKIEQDVLLFIYFLFIYVLHSLPIVLIKRKVPLDFSQETETFFDLRKTAEKSIIHSYYTFWNLNYI